MSISSLFPSGNGGLWRSKQFREIDPSADRGKAEIITDQQIRAVDARKSNIAVGVVYRGRLPVPGAVAEHDLVSEVYHVISGSATLALGPISSAWIVALRITAQ